MIRDLVAMAMIGVHHINDVLVGMAAFFDLGMVLSDDFCQSREVVGD
jgi:hypothetical protein